MPAPTWRWLVALLVSLSLAGCPQDTPDGDSFASVDSVGQQNNDGGVGDAGAGTTDSGAADTAVTDAGVTDTGVTDTGATDTGATDTGATDTATPDTGATDTATPDTSSTDTSSTDSGPTDTPLPDVPPTDAGCTTDVQCDDGDPCTASQCSAGSCQHLALSDWTSCGAGKQCTPKGAPGGCAHTVRGSTFDIAVGDQVSCALLADDQAWCWGRNDAAQLPFGKASGSSKGLPWPQPSVLGKTATIALGGGFGCAIDPLGKLRCWGANSYGQLGIGATTPKPVATPTLVKTSETFTAVSLSVSHGCALRADGVAFCWGIGASGQLGDGKGQNTPSPVQVQGLSGLERVVTGEAFSCARHLDGTVWCWGSNGQGQLGNGKGGTSQWSVLPVKVALGGSALALAAGRDHACATIGGAGKAQVWCWGANGAGQLGNGTFGQAKNSPVQVAGIGFVPNELSLGGKTSCAWQLGGKLACWGDNSHGQLATKAATGPNATPVSIPGVLDLKELAVGESHVCARIVGDQAACWGNNYSGQVGGGSSDTKVTSPTVAGQPPP